MLTLKCFSYFFRRIPRSYWRLVLVIFIFLGTAILLLGLNDSGEIQPDSSFETFGARNDYLHSGLDHHQEQACVQPDLRQDDPAMTQFFHHVPPIICDDEEDWIYTRDSKVFISLKAANKHGNISCRYTPLLMKSDTETIPGIPIVDMPNGTLLQGDHFEIECTGSDGETYTNYHAGIRRDDKVLARINTAQSTRSKAEQPLSILMLGFDSLSRMTYKRKLPKTFRKFTETLKGSVLSGYNIVGDGTPQALIPILTGKTELELPLVLKRLPKSSWVDVYPFVWKEYVKNGYATAWSEDSPGIGTFTYRMVGFKEQPTDHYMRPFYVYASPFRKHKKYCLGNRTRYEVHINWFKKFFTMYNSLPKFGFGFHNEFSHDDSNLVETADDTLSNFLQWLVDKGHMWNTILILMSDHGARFNQIRETIVGKQEERLPMFGFAFPSDFQSRFPERFHNFQKNLNRLSSPFDMYPTLRDIVDYRGSWRKDLNPRSISLFEEIPLNRTCQMADIENHSL